MADVLGKRNFRRECRDMSDTELVELSLTDHAVAFDVLTERHRGRVQAVVAQFMKGTDREDCIQETFLKGLANLPKLRNPEKFASWLTVIARNICIDTIKKKKMLSSLDDNGPWETVHGQQHATRINTPLGEFIRDEERRRLLESLDRLEEKYRKVISMRYFDDQEYSSIAATLGKPLGTIKSLIHRGHGRLRELLLEGAIQSESTVVN